MKREAPMHSNLIVDNLWYLETENDEASTRAKARLADELTKIRALKPFPVVAQKVLDILSNPDFHLAEVTAALEEDPALAAGMLRVANSAFFSGTRPCSSIAQAFVRMGGMAVTESILTVAAMDMFPDLNGLGKKIRDHCASTAALVQTLAREFSPKNSDGIFIAGLMHDVGKLLLIDHESSIYSSMSEEDAMLPNTAHQLEFSTLGFDHAVLVGHVLTLWRFPEPIPIITSLHHQPERAYKDDTIGVMTALLRIADQLDTLFRGPQNSFAAGLDDLASSQDMHYIHRGADDLKVMTGKLYAARLDSLRMFGG
jgi:HD-like signal output (HDOD) protein